MVVALPRRVARVLPPSLTVYGRGSGVVRLLHSGSYPLPSTSRTPKCSPCFSLTALLSCSGAVLSRLTHFTTLLRLQLLSIDISRARAVRREWCCVRGGLSAVEEGARHAAHGRRLVRRWQLWWPWWLCFWWRGHAARFFVSGRLPARRVSPSTEVQRQMDFIRPCARHRRP